MRNKSVNIGVFILFGTCLSNLYPTPLKEFNQYRHDQFARAVPYVVVTSFAVLAAVLCVVLTK